MVYALPYEMEQDRARWSNLHLKVDLLTEPKRRLRRVRSELAVALNAHRNLRNAAYAEYTRSGSLQALGRYYAHGRAIDELRPVIKAVS